MNSDLKYNVFKVMSTRVWRTYFGGKEIEKWQGLENPKDGDMPEEWIASTVSARNPGREHIDGEGLSRILIDGESFVLKELIESDPEGFLGERHYKKYGSSMSFLTKIIDSLNRLTIQVHPDKAFAKNVFNSDYGKTEAWYILGGRKVNGEDPYVLLGFKPGITKELWKKLFDDQDISGMLNSLHKVHVKPGEVYMINGGVPHAIGSGCFLIEIQEPTDYTLRVERTTPEGVKMPDILCHQGAGFDKLFGCFHYEGYTRKQMLEKWRLKPELAFKSSDNSCEYVLVGSSQTRLFSMNKLLIKKSYVNSIGDSFCVAIIKYGQGSVEFDNKSIQIRQGDSLFIPATIDCLKWINEGDSNLEVIECFPPSKY